MSRSKGQSRFRPLRALRRLAVVLGVLSLVAQLLLPLSQSQAAWVEEGLFPPTCSVHGGDLAGDLADLGLCQQCPLCQAQFGDRLATLPDRVAMVLFVALPVAAPSPPLSTDGPAAVLALPPLPSRGPPPAV